MSEFDTDDSVLQEGPADYGVVAVAANWIKPIRVGSKLSESKAYLLTFNRNFAPDSSRGA